jgi:alcohol dehydrogenase
MRAAVFHGPGDVRLEQVPDPRIEAPTDAVVRMVRSSVCGSDLWFYRGVAAWEPGWRTGHELTGVVEEVGDGVTTLRPGDLVVAAFAIGDGTCAFCRVGLHTSCLHGGYFGGADNDGGQAEYARVPWADGTCWVVPSDTPERRYDAVHLLSDVLLTGYHAAVLAGVGEAGRDGQRVETVVVVGDGAVGLSGVVSARLRGAETIVACGHHRDRLALAAQLGATATTDLRGDDLVAHVRDLTGGGAAAVLECVGTTSSLADAVAMCGDGGRIGMVGVPAGVDAVPVRDLFSRNLTLAAGVAPTRAYIDEVGPLVASGEVDPSPIASTRFALDDLPAAYAAMDDRSALKAILTP